jgi:hypothetical protein
VIRSLQFGMGDEGRIKNAMTQGIAQDASPDRAAVVLREYEAAAARAAASRAVQRSGPAKRACAQGIA